MRFNKTGTDDVFNEMTDESNSKSLGDITALHGQTVKAVSTQYAAGGCVFVIRDGDGKVKGVFGGSIITEEKVVPLKHAVKIAKGDTLHCLPVAVPT